MLCTTKLCHYVTPYSNSTCHLMPPWHICQSGKREIMPLCHTLQQQHVPPYATMAYLPEWQERNYATMPHITATACATLCHHGISARVARVGGGATFVHCGSSGLNHVVTFNRVYQRACQSVIHYFKGRVNPVTISKPEICVFFHHFKHEYVSYHYQHE